MVEVFKTNVQQTEQAGQLIKMLNEQFPECKINFDLQDRDKILRVKHNGINSKDIALAMMRMGFHCEELQG